MEIKSFLRGYRNLCKSMLTHTLPEWQIDEWRQHGEMASLAIECLERREAEEGEVAGILMRGGAVMIGTRMKYEAVILCDTMPADLNDTVTIRRRAEKAKGGEGGE